MKGPSKVADEIFCCKIGNKFVISHAINETSDSLWLIFGVRVMNTAKMCDTAELYPKNDRTHVPCHHCLNCSSSGCSKDIKVTIQSSQALKLENERILCQITEIAYGGENKPNHVADWDDRVQTVNWIDVEHNGRVTKRKVRLRYKFFNVLSNY